MSKNTRTTTSVGLSAQDISTLLIAVHNDPNNVGPERDISQLKQMKKYFLKQYKTHGGLENVVYAMIVDKNITIQEAHSGES